MSNLHGLPHTEEEKAAHLSRNISQTIRGLLAWLNPQIPILDDMDALNRIYAEIERLKTPAPYTEGQLRRQSNGRWLLSQQGDHEFSSGSAVEIWDGENWEKTSIEHVGSRGGYYATNGMPLKDGAWVRVPRVPR